MEIHKKRDPFEKDPTAGYGEQEIVDNRDTK